MDRPLLRQLYGDLAVEVRSKGTGALLVGVADSRLSVVVTVMATDVRRWADSVTRSLAAPLPRRGQSTKWDVSVTGPGAAGGSMALSRRVAPGDTALVLLVTDASFQGVRSALSVEEARSLAGAMKRAAVAALAPPRPATPPATAPPPKKPPR